MRKLVLLLAGCLLLSAAAALLADDQTATTGKSIRESPIGDDWVATDSVHLTRLQGPVSLDGSGSFVDPANRSLPFRQIKPCEPSPDPDDIYWDNRMSPVIPGANGVIYATAVYNGKLYVGGEFTIIGGVFANNIAVWDGTSWAPLGQGTDSCVDVLTVYHDRLFAGGKFVTAGGVPVNRIAAWNETFWYPLGSGIEGVTAPCVRALTVYEDQLIVGGSFNMAGGMATDNLAIWNDTAWSPLGFGMEGGEGYEGPRVNALTVFQGKLIVGGAFSSVGGVSAEAVASWDNVLWSPIGEGLNVVNALMVQGTALIAGTVTGVAESYGSSWWSVGTISEPVYSLALYDDKLVAGGEFTELGWGVPGNNVAILVDYAWQPLDFGIQYTSWPSVNTLTVYDGKLVAGGNFDVPGGVLAYNIAAWSGLVWSALGSGITGDAIYGSPCVHVLSVYNGELIVGGALKAANDATVNGIASWNGSRWSNLGSGTNGVTLALMEFNDTLYVGGVFDSAGGISALGLARWNGLSWSAMSEDPGLYARAFGIYNDQLIVAGMLKIVAWNGSTWVTLQEGIGGGNLGTGSSINALAAYHDRLIAGGNFAWFDYGDVDAIATAKWNGSYWLPSGCSPEPFPPRPHATVNALIVHNDTLIGGGTDFWHFNENGWQQDNVWQRDDYGCRFIAVGNPLTINAMTMYNDMLIVGGVFDTINGIPANNIAAWDGTTWLPLGSGIDGVVTSLAVYNDALYVGGSFVVAGGKVSAYLARWTKRSFMCGDANGDGNVGIGDAVYIVNYVFRGGPAPIPLEAGDANGNGEIGIGDAVYIVTYIFRGGPAPCCP